MTIRLGQHAVDDLHEATEHYAGPEPDLREQFLDDVDLTMARIETFPHGAPPVEGVPGVRRARMRRFPSGVFYRVEDDGDLLIVRVLHSQRQADLDL